MKSFFLVILIAMCICGCPNNCNGNGECNSDSQCICHKQNGVGLNEADFSFPIFTGADCSLRTCPTGVSFSSLGKADTAFKFGTAFTKERMLSDIADDSTPTVEPTKEVPPLNITADTFSNKTLIEAKVENPFKAPSAKGGTMICDGEVVNVFGSVGDNLIVDRTIEDIASCQVSYVRSDLSLIDVMRFNGTDRTDTWLEQGTLFQLYGFIPYHKYNVRVACIEDFKTGKLVQMDNAVTMEIVDSEGPTSEDGSAEPALDLFFTYTLTSTPPSTCFLLASGVKNDGSVASLDISTSELSMFVGKTGSETFFGANMNQAAVIQTVTPPLTSDGTRLLSESRNLEPATPTVTAPPLNDNGKSAYFVDFKASYNFNGQLSTSARTDWVSYVRFLKVGSRVTLFVIPTLVKTTVSRSPVEVECTPSRNEGTKTGDYNTATGTGCFILYLENTIQAEKDSVFTFLLSPDGVHPISECSGNGLCDRSSGQCQCYPGYGGDACQRFLCPNDCSNNGRCVKVSDALGTTILPKYPEGFGHQDDKYSMFACICDRGHRGSDCSLLECPSSTDPIRKDTTYPEKRDCSGRGLCNYKTGNCECFASFYGTACETLNPNQ